MALRVNGEVVPDEEINQEFERLRPDYDRYVREHNAEGGDGQLRTWSRENVIERVLIRQEAMKLADPPPVAVPDGEEETEEKREDAVLQEKIQQLIDSVWEEVPEPTSDEVKAHYKTNKKDYHAPEQIRASHIVKHVNAPEDRDAAYVAILNVKSELDKGTSFEDLASKNSDCPDNAGDLGYFGKGQMVQEFEDVAFGLQQGEVSGVFESPFGFHIAKVYDRYPGGLMPLEQVQERIAEQLREEKRQKALEAYVDSLKATATIEAIEAPDHHPISGSLP